MDGAVNKLGGKKSPAPSTSPQGEGKNPGFDE